MIESSHVRLSDLFAGIEDHRIIGAGDTEIQSLCYRSDRCAPNCLFFCVPGFVQDGHDYAADAVAKGAVALCVERPLALRVSQVVVPSVRRAMGPASSVFYGCPSSRLLTVGITGTNGKTTSAFLIAHILDHAGLRAGLMGTVERRVGGVSLPAGRTTPEALDIQRDLALMVDSGDRAAVMEVSSHALDLGRVLGVTFRAIAFTNLTQDHLDYHGTLETYFMAKRRLFLDEEFSHGRPVLVVNVDDAHGRRLAAECPGDRLITSSCSDVGGDAVKADLIMRDYSIGASGTRGTLVVRGNALVYLLGGDAPSEYGDHERSFAVSTRLVGGFNVANTLTALGVGLGLGLDLDEMLKAIEDFRGVPGRMEPVDAGQPFAVLVDYAHTPDSVRNVLETARSITGGRLIVVLGCGGDRDKSKRPRMGREAEALADVVIVTSDNPRTEDPMAIISDILAGLESPGAVLVHPDRRQAIRVAIEKARQDDVVLILGKGHESGQEFAHETIPFDDREVARGALEEIVGVQP